MNTIDQWDPQHAEYQRPISTTDLPYVGQELHDYYYKNFMFHYEGNRSPFGIWLHPTWLVANSSRITWLNNFLQEILQKPNVWVVSGEDVIAYMKNPVNSTSKTVPFKCPTATATIQATTIVTETRITPPPPASTPVPSHAPSVVTKVTNVPSHAPSLSETKVSRQPSVAQQPTPPPAQATKVTAAETRVPSVETKASVITPVKSPATPRPNATQPASKAPPSINDGPIDISGAATSSTIVCFFIAVVMAF
jgi:hypothetical protein